jgi:hypothetical protein
MSQHYSNPNRESETYSLPDVETFLGRVTECQNCGTGGCLIDGSQISDVDCPECGKRRIKVTDTKRQWFYWFCFPGCLPDSDPIGPFATEDEAIADARENAGGDDEFFEDDRKGAAHLHEDDGGDND